MLLFVRRSKRSDPYLEWKVRIFSVAAVLTLVGMYMEERWMTITALGLLAVAMVLRFMPADGSDEDSGADEGAPELEPPSE